MIKLIKQDVKNIGHIKDYKGIEKIARLCYRSEDKITESSYLRFIKMLLKNGHLSVLEHLNIILKIDHDIDYSEIFMFRSPYFQKTFLNTNSYIISGSLRSFYEYCLERKYFLFLGKILMHLGDFDEIFKDLKGENKQENKWMSCMEFKILSENIIMECYKNNTFAASEPLLDKHITHTFYIVCNRGISHEYVRHRATHAITQESTRFVKYDEVEMILPVWFYDINDKNREAYDIWYKSCERDADVYKKLLNKGFSPQQARDNLPHSLRTSLYSTMNLWQWKHFLKLRTSEKAHPLIQEIAKKIQKYLKKEYPCVF